MATSRPFAYNTGDPIDGTEQFGNISVGYPTNGFESTGLKWWNGPDEDLGYVIAVEDPSGSHVGADSETAYLGFGRSQNKTESSFKEMVNSNFGQSFLNGLSAKTWLNGNGYWTSFEVLGPSLIAELDASNSSSYSGSGTTWFDLVGTNNGTLNAGSGSINYTTSNGGEFTLSGGTGTRIQFNDSDAISLSTDEYKTYVLWFKSNNTLFGSFRGTIMSKMSSASFYDGFYIGWDSANKIQVTTNGSSSENSYISTNSFTKNQWYMLTFVCKISSDSNSTKLYMNGSLELQGAHGADTISDTDPLFLGGYGSGVGNAASLVGGISEMAVYQGELSQSSITSIFDNTKSRFGY